MIGEKRSAYHSRGPGGGDGPGGDGEGPGPAQNAFSSGALQPAAVRFPVSDATHMVHASLLSFRSGAQSAWSFARHLGSIAAVTEADRDVQSGRTGTTHMTAHGHQSMIGEKRSAYHSRGPGAGGGFGDGGEGGAGGAQNAFFCATVQWAAFSLGACPAMQSLQAVVLIFRIASHA